MRNALWYKSTVHNLLFLLCCLHGLILIGQGSNGATKELCRKDGLSQQSMEQANWLMQQLMKEVPRAVNIIEALKAAGEGVSGPPQPDLLSLVMLHVLTFLV